jgi:hypothetical protein
MDRHERRYKNLSPEKAIVSSKCLQILGTETASTEKGDRQTLLGLTYRRADPAISNLETISHQNLDGYVQIDV